VNKLLIGESPVLVLPTLAVEIARAARALDGDSDKSRDARPVGLNEAIVLQQLHWLVDQWPTRVVEVDGFRWFRAEQKFWQERFPFWSERTIRRTFEMLKKLGLVETQRGREANVYRVNYEGVVKLTDGGVVKLTDQGGQVDRSPSRVTRRQEEHQRGQHLPGMEPEEGETAAEPDPTLAQVNRIWTYYLQVFAERLRVKELTPPRERVIRKALRAVNDDAELCCRSLAGLKAYRDANPNGSQDVSLGVVFETGPHSSRNLTDQIEWWASQADERTMVAPKNPSVTTDRISRRRLAVVEMHAQPHNSGARERGEEAAAWLREHAREEAIVSDGAVTGWRKLA
jgi:hypothetical protein